LVTKKYIKTIYVIIFVASIAFMNAQAQPNNVSDDCGMPSNPNNPNNPNIVLVHVAWADGSSWSKAIPLLQERGYNVTAVQIPLTSLADDVAVTNAY